MKNYFDDSFRKKWETIHFPVNEDHRSEMARLLEKPRRRKGLFWWVTGLGLSILAIALLFFISDIPSSAPDKQNNLPIQAGDTSIQDIVRIQNKPVINERDAKVAINELTKSIHAGSPPEATTENSIRESVTSRKPVHRENSIETVTQTDRAMTSESLNGTMKVQAVYESIHEAGIVGDQSSLLPITQDLFSHRSDFITEEVTSLNVQPIDANERSRDLNQPVVKFRKPVFIFAETGAEYLAGKELSYDPGFALHVGAGIQTGILQKLSVFASGGYHMQKEGFEFERTSTVNVAGFGARSNFHSLTPDQLHFVYANLGLEYQLKKHVLQISGDIQYLYGAQGWITVQTQDQLEGQSEVTEYAWLKLNGMNRSLWGGAIRYGYRLSPRVTALGGVKINFSSLRRIDPDLSSEGYYWDGKQASWRPSFTIKYYVHGK